MVGAIITCERLRNVIFLLRTMSNYIDFLRVPQHLGWLLSPITVNNWLEMMLQFIYQKFEKKNYNLLTPHFSSSLFKRLCQLLDLVTLDITSLRYSYCVLAAAAIYILVDPRLAISISGN